MTEVTLETVFGIPALDDTHKALFAELDRMKNLADAEFGSAYLRLVDRLERDFSEEERLMEELEFPGLQSHREQHIRVLAGLHHTQARVMGGDIALGRHTVDLLEQWLSFHIATMDQALAVAMQLATSSQIASPAA